MTRRDDELIREALDHLERLRHHQARGDLTDETVADAVSLRLAAAIESLSRVSEPVRARLVGEEWPVMWATRNRIAHGYANVDREVIVSTILLDLPDLERRLRRQTR